MNLEGLDHVALSVADLERSERWYTDVIGLERVYADQWDGVPAFLMRNGSGVALFPASAGGEERAAIRILHFAFRVDRTTFEAAQARFRELGVEFRFSDHDVSHSIYLRDPDGHQVELTTYEL